MEKHTGDEKGTIFMKVGQNQNVTIIFLVKYYRSIGLRVEYQGF